MNCITCLVGVLGAGLAVGAFGQDGPGHPGFGADGSAAEAIEHIKDVQSKPSGIFFDYDEGVEAGVDERRMPSPRGLYPVVDHPVVLAPLFSSDPAQPLADAFNAIRKSITDPVSLDFNPAAAWTYQHATKVVDGSPHAKSILWEAISSTLTLWHYEADYGQVVCVLQNNVGMGTPLEPFLGPGVGDPTVINNVLVSSHLTTNLYWQQSFGQDSVRLRVGKISDSGFFDRNAAAYDPLSQFMSLDFNQSITNPFPPRGFGGVLSADFSKNFTVRAGTLNSASTGATSGFDGLAWNHLFTIVEGDLRIFPTIGGRQREGHIRLMGWYNSIPNSFGTGTLGGPGVTLNIDQAIADHATAFMRVGWGQQDVTVSNFAISAGFGVSEPFGLKSCQTGIGIEYAKISQHGRDSIGLLNAGPGEHSMLEWYWRVRMSESTDTGPVIQVVRDPRAGIDTSVIWGWRTTIGF
jgi:hypothetical protein